MKNNLIQVTAIVAIFMASSVCADSHEDKEHWNKLKNRIGYWKAEDCKKVSDASGLFLFLSGGSLKEAEKFKKAGKKKESERSFMEALNLSEIASNYANNFNSYCK